MECPSTPSVIVLVEDDAISLGSIYRDIKLFFIDTCSDTICWVPWNRLEGVNSYFSDYDLKRRKNRTLVCEKLLV